MTIDFIKTQALGNDFLLTERGAIPESGLSGLAQRICHRNFGVGADGLIYYRRVAEHFDHRLFDLLIRAQPLKRFRQTQIRALDSKPVDARVRAL